MTIQRTGHSGGLADTLHFATQQLTTSTVPRYLPPGADGGGNAVATDLGIYAGRSGRITGMRVRHVWAGTGAATITYTLMVDGVDTISVDIENTAPDDTTVEVLGNVAVKKNDRIAIRVDKSASLTTSPIYCDADLVFDP